MEQRKDPNILSIIAAGLAMMSLVISAVLFMYATKIQRSLKEEIDWLYTLLRYFENETETQINLLRIDIRNLNTEINTLHTDVERIENTMDNILTGIRNDISSMRDRIDLLEKYIIFIKDWMNTSKEINMSLIEKGLSRCVSGGVFDVECFVNYLYYTKGIRYEADPKEYEKIQKPNDFLIRKEGDCEDFAYLYTVIINKLIEQGRIHTIKLAYIDYLSRILFGPYVTSKNINISDKKAYTICYESFEEEAGHCITGLCNYSSVVDAAKLYFSYDILDNCVLFEPQTGFMIYRFLGYTDGYNSYDIDRVIILIGDGICIKGGEWFCVV